MNYQMKKYQCLVTGIIFMILLRGTEFALLNAGYEDILVFLDLFSFILLYIFLGIKFNVIDISKITCVLICVIVIYIIIETIFSVPSSLVTYKDVGTFGGLYKLAYALTILYDWIYVIICYIVVIIIKTIIYYKNSKNTPSSITGR